MIVLKIKIIEIKKYCGVTINKKKDSDIKKVIYSKINLPIEISYIPK